MQKQQKGTKRHICYGIVQNLELKLYACYTNNAFVFCFVVTMVHFSKNRDWRESIHGICGVFWRVCLQLVVRETFSYQYLINYVNYRDEIHMYMYILTGWFSQQYHILFMQSIKTFFVHIIFKNETVHYKGFALANLQSVIIIVELRLNKTSFYNQFNSMYLANKLIFTDRSQSQLRSKNACIDMNVYIYQICRRKWDIWTFYFCSGTCYY